MSANTFSEEEMRLALEFIRQFSASDNKVKIDYQKLGNALGVSKGAASTRLSRFKTRWLKEDDETDGNRKYTENADGDGKAVDNSNGNVKIDSADTNANQIINTIEETLEMKPTPRKRGRPAKSTLVDSSSSPKKVQKTTSKSGRKAKGGEDENEELNSVKPEWGGGDEDLDAMIDF